MPPKDKAVVDVNVKKEEAFTVTYKNKDCKEYAISVLNVLGFMARNDDKSGNLERKVTVHVSSRDLKTTKEILEIFGSSVQRVPLRALKKSVFRVKFKDHHQKKALDDLNALKDVQVTLEPRDTNASEYKNAPLTLNVVGDVAPETVLDILNKHGEATHVKAGTSS